MAIVVIVTTPGITAEHYDETIRRQNLNGGLPAGCSAHIAGLSPDGWRVVAVWDSPEAMAAFQREVLQPIQRDMGISPPPTPPVIYPLHALVV